MAVPPAAVRRIHVVYSNHLDVGFNGASLGAIQRLAAVLAGGACPRLVEVAVEGNVPPHVHVGGALKNSGAMNARASARRMRCK